MFLLIVMQSLWLLLVFHLLMHRGEELNFPAMNRAISDWIPQKQAARAVSIILIGVPGALLLGGPLFSTLIGKAGWRSTFQLLGLGGAVMFLMCILLYRDPSPDGDRF